MDSTALEWDSLKADADQVFSLALDLLLHPKFSAAKLELAQQQEATGIVRRTTMKGRSPAARRPSLVVRPQQPYTRQPELATIGAVTLRIHERLARQDVGGKLGGAADRERQRDFDPRRWKRGARGFEGLPQL